MRHRIEWGKKGEIELTWRLIGECGKIRLQAKDNTGTWWYIFSVQEDGKGYLEPSLPKGLGLPLEDNHTLKLR